MKRKPMPNCKPPRMKRGFEVDAKVEGWTGVTRQCNSRVTHLANLYTAIKGWYSGRPFYAKARKVIHQTCFIKLEENIREWEKETGAEVHDPTFIISHFRKYGKLTAPQNYLSKQSFKIYEKYEHESSGTVYRGKSDEMKTLMFLASVRNESLIDTFDCLKNAGVFSKQFIKQWENQTWKIDSTEGSKIA